MSNLFNLKYQLVQYGVHHNNRVNILIHLVCVPVILWTAMVFLANTGPLVDPAAHAGPIFAWILRAFGPDGALALTLFYVNYYFLLAPDAAILYIPILFFMSLTATQFNHYNANANQIAASLHIVSWILQFIGHGLTEKRNPKLMDNLVQAVVLAPFFVFYEILFAFGFHPELKAEVQQAVDADIKAFKTARAIPIIKVN
ncbi:hypothetical protein BC936DRAFT_144313 [Jimgerdemannia flammicorona]|uniref:DUF962 domain protein n=1 Tax=Jimgerdemannia flammicorona TaxID=994334 RepID=A0A433DCM3_9FUNG|nr:hypothetical protein BC936DRAFT_144313 [Jimgerdemannia flammicorona]